MESTLQNSVEIRRQEIFSQLEKSTRLYPNDIYQKIYALHKEHWGINSPACVLYNNFFSSHPYRNLLPTDLKGNALIAINQDSVPNPNFIDYLKVHEYWEHYSRVKTGFNLLKSDERDYSLPLLDRKRPSHKLAILKEFQSAQKDGLLDDYMNWWRDYYQRDIRNIDSLSDVDVARISNNYGGGGGRETIKSLIRSNLQIREKLYDKVKSRG